MCGKLEKIKVFEKAATATWRLADRRCLSGCHIYFTWFFVTISRYSMWTFSVGFHFINRIFPFFALPISLYTSICNCGQNIGCRPDILDRKSTLNATLFRVTVETVFAWRSRLPFVCVPRSLAVADGWTVRTCPEDRTRRLARRSFQSARSRVLLGERRQSVPQSGIVGLDVCCVLTLVEQNDGFLFILLSASP